MEAWRLATSVVQVFGRVWPLGWGHGQGRRHNTSKQARVQHWATTRLSLAACHAHGQAAGSPLRLGSQGLHFTRVSLKCRSLSGEDVSRGDYCECLGCFLLLRVASYLMRRIHWVSKKLKFSVGRWYPTTVWYIGLGQNSNLVCRVRILNSRFQVKMLIFIFSCRVWNVVMFFYSCIFLWN